MAVIMPLKDQKAANLFQNNLSADGGHYLLGTNRHWHGGMHFTINKPVQAIDDGKLIAYRLASDYLTVNLRYSGRNPKNKYSNSFALIQHEARVKGRTLNYYSLYMHLMPASGYKSKPNMAIPDFVRAMTGSDQEAIITTNEDIPAGLNIRHPRTGDIVVTAPKDSIVTLDDGSYSESQLISFAENKARNPNYKMVKFTDHKDNAHYGYALLDETRVKQDGDSYTIITREDQLNPNQAGTLKGLNLRTEKNYDDDTIIKVLKKNTKIKIQVIDTQWAIVKEIDGEILTETAYVFYKGKVKFDENDIDESLLDTIHCPNQTIKSGDLLGYPGVNFSQNNSLHFEIFTDDSIVDFIKDYEDLDESEKTILQVNKGSKLFQRTKVDIPKTTASIDKYSRIKIEDTDADSEYVKITATDICGVVKKVDMERYDEGAKQYEGIKANLEHYQSTISADLTADSRLEFIYYSNAAGDIKTSNTSDGHRLVAFPVAEQKTYWVKRDLINSQEVTTDNTDKGTILFNSLNMLYDQNPMVFAFEEESESGSSDDAFLDLTSCKSCKDSDGETWYEVTLPFDDKGILHYLSLLNGVNRTDQKKGWVKSSDTKLTSPFNWPGFKLAKENGEGSQDARIDYQNLTPFFKELFEDIDIICNGVISAREMKAALKDEVLADRLSRVIAKHPSEWQSDDACSKWDHLKEVVPDEAAFEEAKKQIKNLAWWDEAKAAGASLPDSPEVYHLHPVGFIEQLDKLSLNVELVITRFAQWPKKPEALHGVDAVPYHKKVGINDPNYNKYLAYDQYFHALNASQGGTHSKFKFIVNGNVKMTGYMLEAAGPSSQAAGSDQRIMPGKYSLIDNPGSKGDFRLVKTTKEAADELFGKRSLVNIHMGNFPKDIKGCFAPGKIDRIMNEGEGNEYPYVADSETQYNRLRDLIIVHTRPQIIPSYDGSEDIYNTTLYTGLTVMIEEEF